MVASIKIQKGIQSSPVRRTDSKLNHGRRCEQYDSVKYCFGSTARPKTGGRNFRQFRRTQTEVRVQQSLHHGQDVSHARVGPSLSRRLRGQGWNVTGLEVYPTGATRFFHGAAEGKNSNTEIIISGWTCQELNLPSSGSYEVRPCPSARPSPRPEQPASGRPRRERANTHSAMWSNAGNALQRTP